jgi:threonine/homoserine/homoserine lactone efflux protein
VLIVAVGLQLRSTVEHAQNVIVGGVLVATGVAFVALELSGRGHSHAHGLSDGADADGHGHHPSQLRGHIPVPAVGSPRTRVSALAGIMVPFGAAASPDLTILPVFLAAATVGAGTAVGSLIAFAAVTICTIVGLTLLAAAGGYRIRGQWLERWANSITAGVLIVIGTLVLAGAI